MLSEGLQAELEQLLEHINHYIAVIREKPRPNFEVVYTDKITHPDNSNARLYAQLEWHEEAEIGKLYMAFEVYMKPTYSISWIWDIQHDSAIAEICKSSSDAIRWAQREINVKEAEFIKEFAAETIPTSSPADNEDFVCGG